MFILLARAVHVVVHILDHYPQKGPEMTVVGKILDHYHHSGQETSS